MARIRVLPEVLAHKIAAGEIVERPASVVKELLENALDAQASRVMVRVEKGGMRLISVADDGIGMSPEDAHLAFEHHATSKISTFEDLTRITTLGFRGEALPSIASVSRLRLRSAERPCDGCPSVGTEIVNEGGRLIGQREIAWPSGTEVLVEDLFFNVPVRRKFLKTVTTEFSHVSRQVVHYALAYPEVEFQFFHHQQLAFQAPSADALADRVYQVLGESFLENLVPVEYEKEGLRVHGFTSLPHEQRAGAASQYLYVNRRMVRDRVLSHAVGLAYRDLIPTGTYPVVLLFVEIDPEQVDVNVHPSKTEIRFRDSQAVHSAIYHGIEEALLRRKGASLANLARDIPPERLNVPGNPEIETNLPAAPASTFQSLDRYFQKRLENAFHFPSSRPSTNGNPHASDIPETADLSPVPVVLGQFVESFVVVADREGVMLVDQHVAHERILYDRALRALGSQTGCPRQQLLVPLTVDLTAAQKMVLEKVLEALNANGFEVEWFGTQTIAVKGVPAPASSCDVERLIAEILESVETEDSFGGCTVQRLREKIAISLSCRAAIKINTPLSHEKLQWLMDELFRSQNPYTCPHGRPIVLRLNIEDILRGFKRI